MPEVSAVQPRRGSILVVEDSRDLRIAVEELLALYGYLVDGASTAEQALACLLASPRRFALMLLDLRLPGQLSGYDVRARQLADPDLSTLPTVVVTALEPPAEDRLVLHSDDWLEKPFRGDALLEVVKRYVVPGE
ncbi:MAG: response regulator [Vicinamibacterales bacterium]